MKGKFKFALVLMLILSMFVPTFINAEGDTLEEDFWTGSSERKVINSEGKLKANIYMFRGSGCGYCAAALEYFQAALEEYGDKVNLYTYEVWYNEENYNFMNKVAEYLGTTVEGVPFIVVGDEYYGGFQESWGEEAIQKALKLYEVDEAERYDVIDAIDGGEDAPKKDSSKTIIAIVLVVVLVALFVIFARQNTEEETNVKENSKETEDEDEEETVVEEKETTKKTSKTKTAKKQTNTKSKKTNKK